VALLLFALMIVLCGCTSQPEPRNRDEITVGIVRGEGFVAKEYVQHIQRTEDAVFLIRLQDDYEITACSYPDYTVSQSEGGFTALTLNHISYPTRIRLTCEIPSTVILYNPNGGSFARTGSEEALRKAYSPSLHPRCNTLNGEEALTREGYVLTGWNTAPDGTGLHIGLGSRVTTEKNGTLELFAQWEAHTEEGQFEWETGEDGIVLTAYRGGNTASLVLPEKIGNQSVTEIGAGFAEGLAIGELVIPQTVLRIAEGAFRDCSIENIVFFDTLQQVSDAAFPGSRPRYWHINAVMAPRYQGISDITSFADKMDLLILNQEQKKLLLFAGCSMFYGMDSSLVGQTFPDYTVLNLGAVGGTNAQFQLEIMLPYIRKGDVFVHAPEQASSFQLMSSLSCENRIFIAVEGNFDLLAGVDMTTLGEGAFDCFRDFNANRRKLEPGDYDSQAAPINRFGDNVELRASSGEKRFSEQYRLRTELITEEGIGLLCDYYDRISALGARVFLSYAPINILCCESQSEIRAYSSRWETLTADRGYETISDLDRYIMDAKYFYDTDYHLTTSGAAYRAELLTKDLQSVLLDKDT